MKKTFLEKLEEATEINNSRICVGLDINKDKFPPPYYDLYKKLLENGKGHCRRLEDLREDLEIAGKKAEIIFDFAKDIIDATKDAACIYKPQAAYYESQGVAGEIAIRLIVQYILEECDQPVLYDAKRGDIDRTAGQYALAILKDNTGKRFEALTVNPYMGVDAVLPFVEYKDKGVIVLCRPSNPGAADMCRVKLKSGEYYFEYVARLAHQWNANGNIGLVVGAVSEHLPREDIERIRQIASRELALVPGIGAQEGDLKSTVEAISGVDGKSPFIINSSSGITHASSGPDYKERAGKACTKLRDDTNNYLR